MPAKNVPFSCERGRPIRHIFHRFQNVPASYECSLSLIILKSYKYICLYYIFQVRHGVSNLATSLGKYYSTGLTHKAAGDGLSDALSDAARAFKDDPIVENPLNRVSPILLRKNIIKINCSIINELINQSINQVFNHLINQSIDQSIVQSLIN